MTETWTGGRDEDAILEALRDLSFVTLVTETDRPSATHYLETTVNVIERDDEIHAIEHCGARFVGVSTATGRVYVTVGPST